jgi:hypothetical protein
VLEPTSARAEKQGVRDVLGDPDALARAAGVTDPGAVDAARQAHARVRAAEEALRRAYAERDAGVRAAAAANPDLPGAALGAVEDGGLGVDTRGDQTFC